mmetsp:Transcript_91653/g.163117  ORF Transcript_91653/g.163117 Transcript_91653/m.163117 type:complete len:309 (-) Transcript_91653:58-984(-)|eukprot:CAMPEP_0197658176 /NCGR_PEP_ID=MMETSP1338-20131121/45086_1 /TAXON_ID=43686 ORGANISM="Pelagodinium beii, Strain RCC1491" /NCGR_SAMPLE_ID=MMETSP1338 /ASSEMBLY_ACC=CAM_ASM_000754 /LENGTH=308 /DNA_ID=CAMNT_0043234717 /DNA_START=62 /DNA_END=988 /DNA_ORIENTATION=+
MENKNKEKQEVYKRTQLCKFNAVGLCTRGEACSFAHSLSGLVEQPDFYKTRPCKAFMKTGSCVAGDSCTYAHGKAEQHHFLGSKKASGRPKKAVRKPMESTQSSEVLVPVLVPVTMPVKAFNELHAFQMQALQAHFANVLKCTGDWNQGSENTTPTFAESDSSPDFGGSASHLAFGKTFSEVSTNSSPASFWTQNFENFKENTGPSSGCSTPLPFGKQPSWRGTSDLSEAGTEEGSFPVDSTPKDAKCSSQASSKCPLDSADFWQTRGLCVKNTFIDLEHLEVEAPLRRSFSEPRLKNVEWAEAEILQ